MDVESSGAWEPIQYPITPLQIERKNDDDIYEPYTECDDCGNRLWKNGSLTLCPKCGLIYSRNAYDSVNEFEYAYEMKTENHRSGTPFSKRYPKGERGENHSPKPYNHNEDEVRMYGGYRKAYTEDNGPQYAIDNLNEDDQLMIPTLHMWE